MPSAELLPVLQTFFSDRDRAPVAATLGAERAAGRDLCLGERVADPPPLATPLRADDLARLPPALVHCAEMDMLRDEGYRYDERLDAAGAPAVYRCARGMPRGVLRAPDAGPAAAAEFRALAAFLRRPRG